MQTTTTNTINVPSFYATPLQDRVRHRGLTSLPMMHFN
jgi:hypothetical protein